MTYNFWKAACGCPQEIVWCASILGTTRTDTRVLNSVLNSLPTGKEYSTWEVELESAVDGLYPVCSFIHIHLRPKSSGHVTHDSHNLQTKAINHSTRHYMNRRELESDQPIHVPSYSAFLSRPDSLSALSP